MTVEQPRGAELRTQAATAARLVRPMLFMVAEAYGRRHAPVPKVVLEHIEGLREAALWFSAQPPVPPVASCSATGRATQGLEVSRSGEQPDSITTAEAAARAHVSVSYVTRLCRKRLVATSRTAAGGWLIDAADWNAWVADRAERETI